MTSDTALMFRRSPEGAACRQRAATGTLTEGDKRELPKCFHELIEHLESPTNEATGVKVKPADYVNMLNEKGDPREIDLVILRRKLGGIAKGKAPGYSGNGPDLYASLPDSWAVWAVRLANLILFTQVTPHNWHIDLVHYVHKGGVDGSLPNHRPLALVEVFRKVVTSIVCDRLKRDFAQLNILDPTNPGFQTGRTTANSIFPLRIAGEHCLHTETELSALLDDLKWCFDTPASTVVELALRRLGVPMFYINMLNDNDLHSVKSTVTANGNTVDVAGMIHRQLHGTGQGTVEGPINWIPVADIVIAVARARSTQPVAMPLGKGGVLEADRAWFVDDATLMQAGVGSTHALQTTVDGTGLMNYFLGLERRASKCLWTKLRWKDGKLVRKASSGGEQLLSRAWLACWHERGVRIVEQEPVVIKEYDYDEEFRHLGYSASMIGESAAAESALAATARRATLMFTSKPALHHCGGSIVTSVLRPKFVYPLAFAKATEASICRIESGYGNMLRRSLSVAQGFPWEVISGSLEYDGLGVNRLSTEVTKARLRLFQAMMTSRFDTENGMAMAMVRLAQRWCGASTPVNMLHADDLKLFHPLDSSAPQAAHMFYELRSLGYSLVMGWVNEPYAAGDATIYDVLLTAAGEGKGLKDSELANMQKWRRDNKVMWVSELLRADGRTLRQRFTVGLKHAVTNCEPDAMRLCKIAFGSGRTAPGPTARVGLPLAAAWDSMEIGDFVWRKSCVCKIVRKKVCSVELEEMEHVDDLTATDASFTYTPTRKVVAHYDEPPLRVDSVSGAGDGMIQVDRDEVLMLRDVARKMAGDDGCDSDDSDWTPYGLEDGASASVAQADSDDKGICDYDCVAPAHQMLPWGAQYRNLSTAEGHAWVSACLDGDHQLREARRLAQCALKEVDGGALSSTATLLAYSDGSVLAEGIEGSAAAIVCINGREVCAITRLASADRALSSGRTEWGGLVMVLYIAQDIPCEIVLRLDNLQVVNAFNDGPLAL